MRIADLIEAIEREGHAVVVMIAEANGSTPREAGAAMLVATSRATGTIGGGTVEHRALAVAREMLGGVGTDTDPLPDPPPSGGRGRPVEGLILDFPLGPGLDQCCGGHMRVAFAAFGAADLERLRMARGEMELWPGGPVLVEAAAPRPVLIYGAGHVGAALVRALAPLPFQVRWIDARLGAFPAEIPAGVETVESPLPEAEAKTAPPDALHVVLTHSHALDLEIAAAVLERGEFGFLGLIGSATKKALFLRRLRERGVPEGRLARLTCPIGAPGVRDKRPEIIAAATAVQLLQVARTSVQDNRQSA
ncbi:MAG: xanthine dehydrogenase accessory protein XdhC [Alphaproteobacteria bacterium]